MTDYIVTYQVFDNEGKSRLFDHKISVVHSHELENIETPKLLRGANHILIGYRTKDEFIKQVLDDLETQE